MPPPNDRYVMSAKHRLTVCLLLTLAITAGAQPAAALDLESFLPSIFSRPKPVEPPAPVRQARPKPVNPPPSRVPFSVPTADAEKPSPEARLIVTVVGDSLGVQLGQGLREALIAKPDIGLVNKARGNTGLVNMSERDWPRYIRDMTAGSEKNNLTLIMIGSNDNQAIRDEAGTIQEPLSEKWIELYTKRVDDMLAPLKERKIPVLWVGLPPTRYEKLTARFLAFNKIYRERAQKAGVAYIDIWDAYLAEDGKFQASGPDISGEIVKLRAGDGVHFTKPGSRKLAFFVERDMLKLVEPEEKPEGNVSLPPELREQIRLQADPVSPPRLGDIANAVPIPDAAGLAPELRKREAGPILPLTGQPPNSSGPLMQGRGVRPTPDPALKEAVRISEEVFTVGKAQYPKPNRGDDFGWPRR